MNFTIQFEQEVDGRWLAEVPDLPGVLCYGNDPQAAIENVIALTSRVIADRLEHGEATPCK